MDLLRSPAYAVPLVVNLTGSVWFFLLIGKAGEWFFRNSVFWDFWELRERQGGEMGRWKSRGCSGVVLGSGGYGRASDWGIWLENSESFADVFFLAQS